MEPGGRRTRALLKADRVVLATGGVGQLFCPDTNPPEARGLGLAMAALAGATISNAEFVQFHPTALDIGLDPAPLATEALRGEGATLINHAVNGSPCAIIRMVNWPRAILSPGRCSRNGLPAVSSDA